jgi:hypothetical protein
MNDRANDHFFRQDGRWQAFTVAALHINSRPAAVGDLARGAGWNRPSLPRVESPSASTGKAPGYGTIESFLQRASRKVLLGKDHRSGGWNDAVFRP